MNVNTQRVNARFEKVDSVEFTVQLVNNEPESEIIYVSKILQDQIDKKTLQKITELEKQRDEIERKISLLKTNTNPRKTLFGHENQTQYLI